MAKRKKKQKQEIYLSVKDTADRLRQLADDLEKGVVTISDKEFSLSAESGVKINFKSKGTKLSTKIKFSSNAVSDQTEISPAEKSPKPKKLSRTRKRKKGAGTKDTAASNKKGTYKGLKKGMSRDFNTIMRRCIRENGIPDADLVESFYQNSKTMCDFPGMGDEFYKEYLKELEIFYMSYKASDLDALQTSIASLNRIKKACHDKYK